MLTANEVRKLAGNNSQPKKHTELETVWDEIEYDARRGRESSWVYVDHNMVEAVVSCLQRQGFKVFAAWSIYDGYRLIFWSV